MSDDDPQPEWPDDDPEPAPPDDDLEPAPPDDEPLPDQPIDEPQPEWPDDTPEEEKWVDGQGFSPDEDCGNPEDSSGMDPGENSSRDENPDFNEPDLYEPDLDEPDLNEPDLDEPDPDEPDPIKPDPMDLDESEDVGSDRVRRNWKEAMEIDFLKPGEMGSSGVVKDSCAAGSAGEHVSGDYTNHGEPPGSDETRIENSKASIEPVQVAGNDIVIQDGDNDSLPHVPEICADDGSLLPHAPEIDVGDGALLPRAGEIGADDGGLLPHAPEIDVGDGELLPSPPEVDETGEGIDVAGTADLFLPHVPEISVDEGNAPLVNDAGHEEITDISSEPRTGDETRSADVDGEDRDNGRVDDETRSYNDALVDEIAANLTSELDHLGLDDDRTDAGSDTRDPPVSMGSDEPLGTMELEMEMARGELDVGLEPDGEAGLVDDASDGTRLDMENGGELDANDSVDAQDGHDGLDVGAQCGNEDRFEAEPGMLHQESEQDKTNEGLQVNLDSPPILANDLAAEDEPVMVKDINDDADDAPEAEIVQGAGKLDLMSEATDEVVAEWHLPADDGTPEVEDNTEECTRGEVARMGDFTANEEAWFQTIVDDVVADIEDAALLDCLDTDVDAEGLRATLDGIRAMTRETPSEYSDDDSTTADEDLDAGTSARDHDAEIRAGADVAENQDRLDTEDAAKEDLVDEESAADPPMLDDGMPMEEREELPLEEENALIEAALAKALEPTDFNCFYSSVFRMGEDGEKKKQEKDHDGEERKDWDVNDVKHHRIDETTRGERNDIDHQKLTREDRRGLAELYTKTNAFLTMARKQAAACRKVNTQFSIMNPLSGKECKSFVKLLQDMTVTLHTEQTFLAWHHSEFMAAVENEINGFTGRARYSAPVTTFIDSLWRVEGKRRLGDASTSRVASNEERGGAGTWQVPGNTGIKSKMKQLSPETYDAMHTKLEALRASQDAQQALLDEWRWASREEIVAGFDVINRINKLTVATDMPAIPLRQRQQQEGLASLFDIARERKALSAIIDAYEELMAHSEDTSDMNYWDSQHINDVIMNIANVKRSPVGVTEFLNTVNKETDIEKIMAYTSRYLGSLREKQTYAAMKSLANLLNDAKNFPDLYQELLGKIFLDSSTVTYIGGRNFLWDVAIQSREGGNDVILLGKDPATGEILAALNECKSNQKGSFSTHAIRIAEQVLKQPFRILLASKGKGIIGAMVLDIVSDPETPNSEHKMLTGEDIIHMSGLPREGGIKEYLLSMPADDLATVVDIPFGVHQIVDKIIQLAQSCTETFLIDGKNEEGMTVWKKDKPTSTVPPKYTGTIEGRIAKIIVNWDSNYQRFRVSYLFQRTGSNSWESLTYLIDYRLTVTTRNTFIQDVLKLFKSWRATTPSSASWPSGLL